jgi:hypothetical protein
VGLTFPISCRIERNVTLAELELIKVESISERRFLIKDFKSGEREAESLCEWRKSLRILSGSSSKILGFDELS